MTLNKVNVQFMEVDIESGSNAQKASIVTEFSVKFLKPSPSITAFKLACRLVIGFTDMNVGKQGHYEDEQLSGTISAGWHFVCDIELIRSTAPLSVRAIGAE